MSMLTPPIMTLSPVRQPRCSRSQVSWPEASRDSRGHCDFRRPCRQAAGVAGARSAMMQTPEFVARCRAIISTALGEFPSHLSIHCAADRDKVRSIARGVGPPLAAARGRGANKDALEIARSR